MPGDRRRAEPARRRHRPRHQAARHEALDEMPTSSARCTRTSGLLTERAPGGITLAEAEERCSITYASTSPSPGRHPCAATRSRPTAGSSPATCRNSDGYLHYRMVDVSSIKELARRWYPAGVLRLAAKHGGHRALADIMESVQELRYYREAVFVPQPGPDSPPPARSPPRYASPEAHGATAERARCGPRGGSWLPRGRAPARYTIWSRAMSLRAARVLLSPAVGRRWWV